jgi:large subunit ribosomal protein L10
MKREEKELAINSLVETLANNSNFYLTDTSSLTVEKINQLRRKCFQNAIQLKVVKNTLLEKAFERSGKDFSELYGCLKGTTAVMFCESANVPARVIKEFRKDKDTKPALKGAYVQESIYIGDNQVDVLASIKSKNELIGDIVGLLQSPAKNVISALQSGGNTLAGLVKTLQEKNN